MSQMALDSWIDQMLWLWEVVKSLTINVFNQRPIMRAQLLYHLGYPRNVVVARTNEANQRLPGILLQNADASELWCPLPEIGIGGGPLFVEVLEVVLEVKVVLDQV
jgi:hypothetical protein